MSLRHTGAADAWGAHLGEDLVKPLQRPIQVQLDPAGGAGHGLSPARHWERGGLGDVKNVQKHTQTCQNAFSCFGDRLLPRARDTDCLARPRPGGGATKLAETAGPNSKQEGL